MIIAILEGHLSKCAVISAKHMPSISNEASSIYPNIILTKYAHQDDGTIMDTILRAQSSYK